MRSGWMSEVCYVRVWQWSSSMIILRRWVNFGAGTWKSWKELQTANWPWLRWQDFCGILYDVGWIDYHWDSIWTNKVGLHLTCNNHVTPCHTVLQPFYNSSVGRCFSILCNNFKIKVKLKWFFEKKEKKKTPYLLLHAWEVERTVSANEVKWKWIWDSIGWNLKRETVC